MIGRMKRRLHERAIRRPRSLFPGPRTDTLISRLPSCRDEKNPPRYPPITYADYINWRHDANDNVADQEDVAAEV